MNKNLERIIDILKVKKLIILTIIITSIILGYLFCFYLVKPTYMSTETLLLIPSEEEINNSNLTLNSELISTYSNIIKGSNVLNTVINNLNLHMTETELKNNIEINTKEDTYVIEISVSNQNPEKTVSIINELTNVFIDEIKKIYNIENVSIVDNPEIPKTPYNLTYKKYIAISAIIGIFISAIYVFIIYTYDNTIKEENIEKLTHTKLLGKIPINHNKKQELILDNDTKSYTVECLNTIRTNIMYMNSTNNCKTILITSCLPGEGKTCTSANIAVAFAKSNQKVLYIDADLRKGRSNKIFGVDNDDGLSSYLHAMTGNVKEDILLGENYIKETQIPKLHILTRGIIPPNPSELLEKSSNAEKLISIYSNAYDIIIIDAPPCKPVTDSLILSTIADATIIVAGRR